MNVIGLKRQKERTSCFIIGQARIDGGTSQTGSERFNNFFVMQSSGIAAIIAEQKVFFVYVSLQGCAC